MSTAGERNVSCRRSVMVATASSFLMQLDTSVMPNDQIDDESFAAQLRTEMLQRGSREKEGTGKGT
eukprot:1865742-Pleurochrysis_carterae.AAC.4